MKYADFQFTLDDYITCNKFFEFARNNPDIVFVKPDTLIEKRTWSEFLNEKPHPKSGLPPTQRVWISSHSDHPIVDELVNSYSTHFNTWFAVNSESKDPRVIPIPLGMNYGNEAIYSALEAASKLPRTFQNLAFMNFNLHTYLSERGAVYAIFKEYDWVSWKYPLSHEEYFKEIRSHPFVLCPRGNGYDTHRFWEALYLGAIPIVRENPVVLAFKDTLPICIVKNWFDITEEYL
jgi:hypothetical protein